jgi:hypothetical protein
VYEHFTGIPEGATLNHVSWATDGSKIAFTVRFAGPDVEVRAPPELWVADVAVGIDEECLPRQQMHLNPRFLSQMTSHDVANPIHQSDSAHRVIKRIFNRRVLR